MTHPQTPMPGDSPNTGREEQREARIYDAGYDQSSTHETPDAGAVRTYERPASADRPRINVAMLIVLLIVLALLAYAAINLIR